MKRFLLLGIAVMLLAFLLVSSVGCTYALASPGNTEPTETEAADNTDKQGPEATDNTEKQGTEAVSLTVGPAFADPGPRPNDVEAKALPILNEFFAEQYGGSNIGKSTFAIIENYWDLKDVYDFAKLDWFQKGYGFNGNVIDAESRNVYSPDYFEGGYVIAFAAIGSSGSFTYDCSAEKSNGGIKLNVICNEPPVRTEDIGAYIYLVYVEGKYSGETVTVNMRTVTADSVAA